jgi:predicted nucleotide-binding protein
MPMSSEEELHIAWGEESKWSKYNTELLNRLFDNPSIAKEYERPEVYFGHDYLHERIGAFRDHVAERINRLESVLERLDLFPEINVRAGASATTAWADGKPKRLRGDIFIVHGHDEAARETVARFIEKLGLNPVILHERPNAGRTLIEKFEHNSAVGFAIVLLTPDDVGHPRNKPDEARPRARQNVIFELGYFLGKISRSKVCALHKEDVEILSDYHGVVYIPLDVNGAWRLLLAKEIREAGIDFDMNKAL